MTLKYLWAKLFKKLPGSAIQNCIFEPPSKIYEGSTAINSTVGRYTYCGYGGTFINCNIGRFCSIAGNVAVGMSSHPMDWVSMSPAFHKEKGAISNDLATLSYDAHAPLTTIGNDVWIGMNVLIKPGVTIGNGAVIGMGSVVTKDVPPYTIVAGNPAHVIRPRFEKDVADRLEKSRWWDLDTTLLKKYSHLMNDPVRFLEALDDAK